MKNRFINNINKSLFFQLNIFHFKDNVQNLKMEKRWNMFYETMDKFIDNEKDEIESENKDEDGKENDQKQIENQKID